MTIANPIYLTDARGRKVVQVSRRAWLGLQRQVEELQLRDQLRGALVEVADMVAGRTAKVSLAAGLAQVQAEIDQEANG